MGGTTAGMDLYMFNVGGPGTAVTGAGGVDVADATIGTERESKTLCSTGAYPKGKPSGRAVFKDATSKPVGTSIAKGGINVTTEHPGLGIVLPLVIGKVITRNTGVEAGVIILSPFHDECTGIHPKVIGCEEAVKTVALAVVDSCVDDEASVNLEKHHDCTTETDSLSPELHTNGFPMLDVVILTLKPVEAATINNHFCWTEAGSTGLRINLLH